jgi:inner membrane protein
LFAACFRLPPHTQLDSEGHAIFYLSLQASAFRVVPSFVSPVTHFLAGWLLAVPMRISRREKAMVVAAAVVPDIDGLGIIPEVLTRGSSHPLLWFSQYHHSLHTLVFALSVAALAWLLAEQSWKTAVLVFLSFHIHLLCDLAGSRGPDGDSWPIPYLKPFSNAVQLSWRGQWALNAWQNIIITIAMLSLTLWIGYRSGSSPLELVSDRANSEFVAALRSRFGKPR